MMTAKIQEPTLEQLEIANKQHLKDLKLLKHMTEAQFRVFRRNTSIGCLEDLTKAEAQELLLSMLALNQHLRAAKTKQSDKN